MIDTNWIERHLKKSENITIREEEIHGNPLELVLIRNLVNACYELYKNDHRIPIGKLLASAFDLIISADYYSFVGHKGWFYCPTPEPNLYYHFTNCCPRHALENDFHFHYASKPESGTIGKSTSRLLRNFLSAIIKKRGRSEIILKGTEPVDIIVVNKDTHDILFGEIKASPLLSLPLIMDAEKLFNGNKLILHEGNITINNIFDKSLYLFIPEKIKNRWIERKYLFGKRTGLSDRFWGYRSLIELLENDISFLEGYYLFWSHALINYHPRITESIFWLTNACGVPSPRPSTWNKAKNGSGNSYASISDSKTSVGMDRTDDIKKAIYQILKLGSEGKPVSSKWNFKVAIVSNIHAIRHHEEFLTSMKNMIWTNDDTGQVTKAGDLSADHPLYNLFDGIISLTGSHFRDEWLKQVFDLES